MIRLAGRIEWNCQINTQPGANIMFDITESLFRESLTEAIEETLLTDPSADRETVVTELALRWNFSVWLLS